MEEVSRNKFLSTMERIKGGAMCLVGGVIVYFAIENYIKVSNAIIGTEIRMPRILEWSYDNLGLVPSVILQSILGAAVAGYGLYKIATGK